MMCRALVAGAAGHFNAEMMCKFQKLGTAHKLIQLLRDYVTDVAIPHHITGYFGKAAGSPKPPCNIQFIRD